MMVAVVLTQPTSSGIGFALGFLLPSAGKLKESLSSVIERIQDHQRQRAYKIESAQWERENQQQRKQEQTKQQERARAEQTRREQEARQYREQQERAKQQQQERETPKDPPKQPPPRDTRTFEQILGLQAGWTTDDLKTAYRREAHRTHPDRWIGKLESTRKEMEEEYKRVQEAYNRLKK